MNDIVGDWFDPFPQPKIVEHDGIYVVRDDLFPYGSKARAADYLIGHAPENAEVEEWVYGSSPAHGYAQISIPYVCKTYQKKCVLFMAERNMNNLHPYQLKGMDLGAIYSWVPNGMLTVTQKRARDYVNERPNTRRLLPIGLDCIEAVESLRLVATALPIRPATVWCVASSGTLSWALQLAWPEADHHMVLAGGHTPADFRTLNTTVHVSKYKFGQRVKDSDLPPFPSAPEYDAKVWPVLMEYRKNNSMKEPILFWNVGA